MTPAPGRPLTRVDVLRVHRRAVPRAAARTVTDRWRLRRLPGLRFARLLGTAADATMSPAHPTPSRWLLLSVWDSPVADSPEADTAGEPDGTPPAPPPGWPDYLAGWLRSAEEHGWLHLRPVASRGAWSATVPWAGNAPWPAGDRRPCAVLTRARLRPSRLPAFLAAASAVAAELRGSPGLRFAVGFGEAPLGWQGTLSVWDGPAAVRHFAYGRPAHASAIMRTPAEHWYAEELFARFTVVAGGGSVGGRPATDLVSPTPRP